MSPHRRLCASMMQRVLLLQVRSPNGSNEPNGIHSLASTTHCAAGGKDLMPGSADSSKGSCALEGAWGCRQGAKWETVVSEVGSCVRCSRSQAPPFRPVNNRGVLYLSCVR